METLKIYITSQKYEGVWGDDPLVTVNNECGYIHLTEAHSDLYAFTAAGRKFDGLGFKNVKLEGDGWNFDNTYAFIIGYHIAFDKNNIELCPFEDKESIIKMDNYLTVFDWLRCVINAPASELYPESFVQDCINLMDDCGNNNVTAKVIGYEQLLEEGYVGTYAVGKGSDKKPCVLIAEYNPNETEEIDVALVGKGITFDSGGYSLKPSDSMLLMKSDMGGAATMVAAFCLMVKEKLPYHVKLVICCAENMVSGSSYKVGDIIQYPNEITAEVINTDAEGRLVLADGLLEAQKQKPKLLIDAATLTGAAKVALGRDYNAALSFDEELSCQFRKSALKENERAWPLPLEKFHVGLVKGNNSDIVNSVSIEGTAGATTAAAFLSYFVEKDQRWLHIDLAASFQKSPNEFYGAGAKGHGFRSIVRFIQDVLK